MAGTEGCYLPGQQLLLHRLQMIHIHVFLAAPLRPCHTTQSGAVQHQRRISVREGSKHPRPAPDLPVHPLDHIVGSDLHPMLGGEVTVSQRFLDAIRYFLRSLRQFHGLQLGNNCGSLLSGRLLALLGMDRLEHLCHIFDFGFGHNTEHISIKMHHTALVLGLGKHLSHSLQHT